MSAASPYLAVRQPQRGGWPYLRDLDFELTHRCNNDCAHCWVNLPAHAAEARDELTTAEVHAILDQAAALGCRSLRLTGGEPLLRPDLADIYRRARRLRMAVRVATNARLVSDEIADLFADEPAGIKVEVSVYGMSAPAYQATARSTDGFAEAWAGIRRLEERAIPFDVRGVRVPGRDDDQAELERWAAGQTREDPTGLARRDSSREVWNPPRVPGQTRARGEPSLSMTFDLRVRRDDPARNRTIAAMRARPAEVVSFFRDRVGASGYARELARAFAPQMYPRSDELFTCGAGLGKVAIDPYGVAYPCLHLRAPGFGRSVRDGGLDAYVCQDIPRLRDRRASAPEYLGRCGRCFLRGLCEQCPGKAWIEHGTVDAPVDYLCEVAHAQARAIGLLGPDERAWQIDDFHTRVAGLVARTRDENDEDMERGATG